MDQTKIQTFNNNKREYFLDWIRVLVVAFLVPHHAAITFSHIGDAYVYLPVADQSFYFFLQSSFFNIWCMRILFFVSGISTFYALRKRNNKEYLIDRFKRLIIPLIFGILVICPLTAYFLGINSYGFEGSILAFYPEFFKHLDRYLGWGHLWYLAYLFVYSLILILLRMILKNKNAFAEKTGLFFTKSKNILIPIFVFVVLEMIFRPFYPGRQNLINDWANFTIYLSLFMLGYIIVYNKNWIQSITSNIRLFFIIALISGFCFIFLKYGQDHIFISYYQENQYLYKLLVAFFQGAAEYSWVLLLIGLAKKYLDFHNNLLNYLTRTSFSLYMYHFLILSIVMYFLIKMPWNHYLIYVIAICLTYIIFFVLFEILFKRVPFLRYIGGIKKKEKKIV